MDVYVWGGVFGERGKGNGNFEQNGFKMLRALVFLPCPLMKP